MENKPWKPGAGHAGVGEYPAVAIPRCGPASPFKGHLSTKSNAFCIDSSQSLTDQYLIRRHMMCHYNKILSAKAAVDCSMPKSRLTSIKLADQQRREKLKKKIARCEEEMSVYKTASRCSSRGSSRLLASSLGKSFLEAEDKDTLSPYAGQAPYLSRALSPYGGHGLVHSSPVKYGRKGSRNTSSASSSSISTSRPARKHTGSSCSRSTDSFVSITHSQRRQGSNSKVCSGDLLERHSEFFTKSQKAFTPRTLISDAKSFLPEYKYYTPARRKRKHNCKQHVEAQTQTDVISFPTADKVSERRVKAEQQKITLKAEDRRYTVAKPEREIDAFPFTILRETSLYSQQSSLRRSIKAKEEELLYLTFIKDVTNEILSLGLFSNRALEQLFEGHIEENKNCLDEGKMRHMLDVLKTELGCGLCGEAEQVHAGSESPADFLDVQEFDMMEEFGFTSTGYWQRKATESEEFFGTMDLVLKEPNKYKSLLRRERSKETQSKEDLSEDVAELMNGGTESDSCVKSEHPDTSPTCEATLDLIACDDLEVNKELDDLEESFAEALQISEDFL
ncbi:PREDICTED: spermatogenesis-associated protein 7 [Acanthisitta chloris]|uniref:spermatogenesis-associated protein 7 n=1 Tax=Acanthisitta chloris TaxID=57068 RepID=UPI0004F0E5A0|nr:PREDICTED: spermatogenesis-associated protein 7 [Acanthisitta chloris]